MLIVCQFFTGQEAGIQQGKGQYYFQKNPNELTYKAKAEKYAKIISKTIILNGEDSSSYGQNAYFYDAAEGLLTATILLVAEFCEPQKRHIVSVFKIIQELLAVWFAPCACAQPIRLTQPPFLSVDLHPSLFHTTDKIDAAPVFIG